MPPTKTAAFALVAALLLSISACGSTSTSSPTSNPPSSGGPPSSAPTEGALDASQCTNPAYQQTHTEFCANSGAATQGPADSVASFADSGLTARILAVRSNPADSTRPGKPGETRLITVVVELANTASSPYVFPSASGTVAETLFYGKDLYEATSWTVTKGGRTDLPTQLTPGSTARTTSQFTAQDAVPMVFGFSPDSSKLPTYTWQGIESRVNK